MKTIARTDGAARGGECGFALLLVFLMAAVIGIVLFAELPRVAIQAQRAKEQLLIERGEQFKRAIQLYLRANKGTRFPVDTDDLDRGYNNLRFLRHRYKDPMTGKDEWRILHMQGGALIDSLLNKPKNGDKPEESTLGQNISAQAGLGQTGFEGQPQPNASSRRRPSEGGTSGGTDMGGQTNGTSPSDGTGGTTQQPGNSGTPGGPISPFGRGPGSPGFPGMPGQFPGQPPGSAGGTTAGSSGDSGSPVAGDGSTPGGAQNPANAANGTPGAGLTANSSAAAMFQNMLTQPHPGGPPNFGQTQGTAMAGGMAGVASKMDSEGLMVYNDRTNYKEWEFVYDPSKDRPRQDPRNMLIGNQMGTPSNATPGASTTSSQSGAFNQPGQTGTGGQTGAGVQASSNGQTGSTTNTGGGQGGSIDIRPGKR